MTRRNFLQNFKTPTHMIGAYLNNSKFEELYIELNHDREIFFIEIQGYRDTLYPYDKNGKKISILMMKVNNFRKQKL